MNAEEIKALRLQLNMTQAQLAAKLRISRSAVAKIETDKNHMSAPVEELALRLKKGSKL